MNDLCRCEQGAYVGTQLAGEAPRCERCRGLIDDQAAQLLDRLYAEAMARLKEKHV